MLKSLYLQTVNFMQNYQLSVAEKEEICRCTKAKSECDFASIELVYGSAGELSHALYGSITSFCMQCLDLLA